MVCCSVLPSFVLLIQEKYCEYDGVRSSAPGKTFSPSFSAAWHGEDDARAKTEDTVSKNLPVHVAMDVK
jgi:hypothetical protein